MTIARHHGGGVVAQLAPARAVGDKHRRQRSVHGIAQRECIPRQRYHEPHAGRRRVVHHLIGSSSERR